MIYIVCPTDVATGGTEVLHQLHLELIKQGFKSGMVFIGYYDDSPVQKKFSRYDPIVIDKIEDIPDNAIIVPEPNADYAFRFHNLKVALWWLSVNNYKGVTAPGKRDDIARRIKRSIYNYRVMKHDIKWLHLVQSEYARQYVVNVHHIENQNIMSLSDYLSDEHFSEIQDVERKDTVLYNPKKGYGFTKRIIEGAPEINWQALTNLTSAQMREKMCSSKVYIDFGTHPGKDRIPREAAMAGCCVITGRLGSAANGIDVSIPERYKFEQADENIGAIISLIKDCLLNYEQRTKEFETYRNRIIAERAAFAKEVHDVGARLEKKQWLFIKE